ncbi:MAG TPA: insulinase family protein, partial [Rhodanobacteraceae bacterium]|nr:insulinase family protein [Rhodanobacteraceae bacterium]
WPNNATVTVVGDFDPATVLAQIKQNYGAIPHSPQPIPEVYTVEPEQQGARRVTVQRAAASPALMIGYKVPSARNPDAAALTVLGLVLQSGKSSRLSRALVDTSLVTEVAADMPLLHDNSLFTVGAMLVPGVAPKKVEDIVLAEIDRIRQHGVEPAEIGRALGPYRAEQAYLRDGTGATAAALNEYIAMGDWTLYDRFLGQLEKVTPADVQRVAKKYLLENRSTTGWFVPEASK